MRNPLTLTLATAVSAVLLASHSVQAASLYWDINGATAGGSDTTTAPGTWGTDSFWNTDVTGGAGTFTSTTTSADDLFFSAGTNVTGASPISVTASTTQSANSITFQEGTVTVGTTGSGGISLGAGGITLVSGLPGNQTVSSNLSGGLLLTAGQTWTNNTNNRSLMVNAVVSTNAAAGQTFTLNLSNVGGSSISIGSGTFGGINDGLPGGGSLALSKSGGGNLTLGGANSYSGGTTVSGGLLTFGATASTVPANGLITLTGSGALAANGPSGFTSVPLWLASGKIVTSSTGVIAIANATSNLANDLTSYPGLSLGSSAGGGTVYSGVLTPGSQGYRLGGGGQILTVSSALDAPTDLLVANNSVVLSSANGYTGLTTINAPTLRITNGGALGTPGSGASGTVVNGTSSLLLDSGITVTGETLTLNSNNTTGGLSNNAGDNIWNGDVILALDAARIGLTGTSGSLEVRGNISDGGNNRTLVFRSAATATGAVILSGTSNSWGGRTDIINGTVRLGADNALPDTQVRFGNSNAVAPSILDLNGHTETVAAITTVTSNNAVNTARVVSSIPGASLTINADTNTSTIGATTATGVVLGGVEGSDFSLTKTGTGILTLAATNSFTGGTTIVGGSISGNASGSFGTGNVSVLDTAINLTIQTGVSNAIADSAALSLAGGGTAGLADFGYASLGSGVNEVVNMLILDGVAQLPGVYGSTSSGAVFQSDEYFSGTGTLTVVVPEPGAALTLFGGVGVLLGTQRLRRRIA